MPYIRQSRPHSEDPLRGNPASAGTDWERRNQTRLRDRTRPGVIADALPRPHASGGSAARSGNGPPGRLPVPTPAR